MRGTSLASLAACLGLTLGGCAIPPSSPYASLAYQQVAPGWTLTVHEPLRVPANQAHADIQAVGSGEMDPYCEFEIDTVSESPQTVEPDVFEVWRVGRSRSRRVPEAATHSRSRLRASAKSRCQPSGALPLMSGS